MAHNFFRSLFAFVCMIFSFKAFSQKQVLLQILQKDSVVDGPVYVAGNFNQWQPDNPSYRLQQDKKGNLFIKIPAKKDDVLEFKFTRGGWDKVEILLDGKDAPNHFLKVNGDTAATYTIQTWRDSKPGEEKQHTLSKQVQVMDTAFPLKAMGVKRRVWLYLPKDYATSGKRYPVLYMQDGQNVFDAYTAAYGEWGVDEMLDSLEGENGKNCIVVAIDHGGASRLTDYNPYNNFMYGKGKGRLYAKTVVEDVKPFIDAHYRTLPDAPNTWVAGSSMGGLISLWMVMQYPNVFGAAGILSPALWMAQPIKTDAAKMLRHYQGKLFFYAGGLEGRNMIPDMDTVISRIRLSSKTNITRRIENNAGHNEASWKAVFPEFLKMVLP